MKTCPNCQTRYTDDTLQFCLQDGTPLIPEITETSAPTVLMSEEQTVVKNRPFDESHTGYTTNTSFDQSVEKSNTFKIVALTVLTMFVLLGAIGTGAWFYLNDKKDTAKVTNTVKNTKSDTKETPTNKIEAKNEKENSETPAPTETPEVNTEKIKTEVKNTIDSWKNAAEQLNENEYMSFYAERLDYYNKKDASIDFVRKDKVKAFTPFDDVEMNVSNLSVTADDKGEIATAVFDKEWVFEGEEKYSEGKVQSQFKFKQFDGKWKIISEKDLKVYYVNK